MEIFDGWSSKLTLLGLVLLRRLPCCFPPMAFWLIFDIALVLPGVALPPLAESICSLKFLALSRHSLTLLIFSMVSGAGDISLICFGSGGSKGFLSFYLTA